MGRLIIQVVSCIDHDYVDILDMIWKAANGDLKYEACLEKERKLSMMYIDDALEATVILDFFTIFV